MPITAERVMNIIYLADDFKQYYIKTRTTLREDVIQQVTSLLYEKGLSEDAKDRIVDIKMAVEACIDHEVSLEAVGNLAKEKRDFEKNAAKNRNSANRMRMLRAHPDLRKEDFRPRGEYKRAKPNVEQQMRDDLEEMRRTGMERHPNQGPCNMDLGGQCSICATAWEPEPDPPTEEPQARDLTPGPGLAARSEQIPTQDDHDSWLPRTKDTLP